MASYEHKGKMAVFDYDKETGWQKLLKESYSYKLNPPTTLFISPDCKIPRALVRNSGYKITISKDKASFIVIPNSYDKEYVRECNLVIRVTCNYFTTLYLCDFERSWAVDKVPLNETESQRLKEKIEQYFASEINSGGTVEVYQQLTKGLADFKVSLIPDCVEFEEMLLSKSAKRYIFDKNVILTPTNFIDLDTLDIWSRMTEKDMIWKSIIGSDYRDYPFTLCYFLRDRHYSLCRGCTEQFKRVLNEIYYDEYSSDKKSYPGTITPKDWNLLQKYMLKNEGLGENGGIIRNNNDSLLKNGVVYKPTYITEPLTIKQIFDKMN